MTKERAPQPNSLQSSTPATEQQIIVEMERLSLPYHRPDMTEGKWKVLFRTYCEDLKDRPLAQIQMACRRWRQNPENKFFPTPGQLLELCKPAYSDSPQRSSGRETEHGWQPWGGACQCEACMKRTRRAGFYHANNAEHTRDQAESDEMDYWMEQQLGYDPKKGNPALDNTTERQRSPAELQALLEKSHGRYPQAFDARRTVETQEEKS